MGGKVFTSGVNPLLTPRMPQLVYLRVRNRCSEILSTYYTHVATPILAPAKKDHGDVDFLVTGPAASLQGQPTTELLGKALGAERHQKASFAVPWPKDSEGTDGTGHLGEIGQEQRRFVQIDVTVCHNQAAWEWALFHHAHGDMWSILGTMTRRLGLTTNDKGLHLRIEDIDAVDRKKSMIFLTQKPPDVLEFLGLDAGRWAKQFDSAQELYEYVASCRFFCTDDVLKNTEEDKKELKHNDRRRMNTRPQFAMWIEQFIPECRAAGTYHKQPWTREQVRDEAFERFGVKDEFEQRLTLFRKERQRDEIWRVAIKTGVPANDIDPGLRAAAIRGLKAIIMEGDMCHGIIPSKPLQTDDGFYVMDEVVDFIKEHWRQVGQLEFQRQQVRGAEKQKLKRMGM